MTSRDEMVKLKKAHLSKACRTHTNLSVFAVVVSTLESGSLYGGVGSDKAAQRIIRICNEEQQRLLRMHDLHSDALIQKDTSHVGS